MTSIFSRNRLKQIWREFVLTSIFSRDRRLKTLPKKIEKKKNKKQIIVKYCISTAKNRGQNQKNKHVDAAEKIQIWARRLELNFFFVVFDFDF